MPVMNEGNYLGDWLKFEAGNLYSRDEVTVIAGQNLATGTVVGIITASGKITKLAPAAADGSQNAAGVLAFAVDATAADLPGVVIARHAIVSLERVSSPTTSRYFWRSWVTVIRPSSAICCSIAGEPFPVTAISEATHEAEEAAPGGEYAAVFLRASALPAPPEHADRVVADDTVYIVFDIEADHGGGLVLRLRRT